MRNKNKLQAAIIGSLSVLITSSYVYGAGGGCFVPSTKKCKNPGEAAQAHNNYGSSCLNSNNQTIFFTTSFHAANYGYVPHYKDAQVDEEGHKHVKTEINKPWCHYDCEYTDPCGFRHYRECYDNINVTQVDERMDAGGNVINKCVGVPGT